MEIARKINPIPDIETNIIHSRGIIFSFIFLTLHRLIEIQVIWSFYTSFML